MGRPRKITVDELEKALWGELEEYKQETTDALKEEVKSAAKICKKEIQQNAPNRRGNYKKGWTVKKAFESETDIRLIIHNKKQYMLTHLLENSHNIKDKKGRILGRTAAHPHIALAEEHMSDLLGKKVQVRFKNARKKS